MRKVLWAFAGLIIAVLGALGAVLAFDAPMKPPPLASISVPFADVDFSDLPTVQTYAARDGAKLGYRVYEGGGAQVVVLIHGSSDDGAGMHPLAKTLRDAGASVYVPVVRGHGNFGRNGDVDHIGQLEDDLADFVAVLRPLNPNATFSPTIRPDTGGWVSVAKMRDPKSTARRNLLRRTAGPYIGSKRAVKTCPLSRQLSPKAAMAFLQ
jgi:hypothetical protein